MAQALAKTGQFTSKPPCVGGWGHITRLLLFAYLHLLVGQLVPTVWGWH